MEDFSGKLDTAQQLTTLVLSTDKRVFRNLKTST